MRSSAIEDAGFLSQERVHDAALLLGRHTVVLEEEEALPVDRLALGVGSEPPIDDQVVLGDLVEVLLPLGDAGPAITSP